MITQNKYIVDTEHDITDVKNRFYILSIVGNKFGRCKNNENDQNII
jgi:hypothetical protein